MRKAWSEIPFPAKVGIVIAAVVGVIALGALGEGGDEEATSEAAPAAKTNPKPATKPAMTEAEAEDKIYEEMTPALLVDVMEVTEPEQMEEMCEAVEVTGRDFAVESFALGYSGADPRGPSGEEVADEILTRC